MTRAVSARLRSSGSRPSSLAPPVRLLSACHTIRYSVMETMAGYLVHHPAAAPVVVRIVLEHDVTDVEDGGNGGVHLYSTV